MKHNRTPYLRACAIALSGIVLLAGCDKTPQTNAVPAPSNAATQSAAAQTSPTREQVELVHVHGLAYTADGQKLLIPSHYGLAVFDGSGWSKAPGPLHDYMGFAATHNALYSSGHPAPDSGLINPFGLIKSTDGGQTWEKLGMEGEADFHVLATSYQTNAVYVANYHPNSKMKEMGIYYTLNDGFSWKQANADGLEGTPISMAVHPTNPQAVAAGTKAGLFLSQNAGDSFQQIAGGETVASYFDLNGKQLWFSTYEQQPALKRFLLETKKVETVDLPALEPQDAVAYIAQNPTKQREYAIATFKRSVYVSPDEGKTWKQIADQGKTL